jgi:hypothetical protein
LYGVAHKNLIRGIRMTGKTGVQLVEQVEKKIKSAVKNVKRDIVVLTDENLKPVSVVSEQHKQLPLSKAYEIVDSIAKNKKAVLVSKRDTGESYVVEYEVNRNRDMSVRVTAYLGRNDALGKAGIRFIGGGNIFVCSNAIIPHVDRDVQVKGNELLNVKIVHTTNVETRLKEQLIKSFDYAKKNATLVARRLTESKSIKMDRTLQKHCINLIRVKHELPDKWNTLLLKRLEEEQESLYGLSQCITYVGTHKCMEDSGISDKLKRIGGQVVLLGKDFVKLIERSFQKKGLEVPKLQVS